MEKILSLNGIKIGYDDIALLPALDMEVRPAEFIAVLGQNGVGKTTLLNTIAGIRPPVSGTIVYGQVQANGRNLHQLARRGFRYIPDSKTIFSTLTVAENLKMVGQTGYFTPEQIGSLFPALSDKGRQIAGSLSGGEQQMLSLAMALVSNPRLVLIDELTEGLQPDVIDRLVAFLLLHKEGSGISILFVEQRLHIAQVLCDRALCLESENYRLVNKEELTDYHL